MAGEGMAAGIAQAGGGDAVRVTWAGEHDIVARGGEPIKVHVFETNLRVSPHDEPGGVRVPGLYPLLREHQANAVWPYTVTNACCVYRDRAGDRVKKLVPLGSVEAVYRRYGFNRWMFEVLGDAGEKFVIRFWSESGDLEVAAFGAAADATSLFVDALAYGDEAEPIADDEVVNDTGSWPAMSDDEWAERSPYVTPAVTDEPLAAEPAPAPEPARRVAVWPVVASAIAFAAFAAQAAFAWSSGGGIRVAAPLAAVAVIALATAIASGVLRGRGGMPTACKVLAGLTLALLVAEVAAGAAVMGMARTGTLPEALSGLRGLL